MGVDVTYLFGAGASFGAVPLVAEMPFALEKFEKWFNENLNLCLSNEQCFPFMENRMKMGQFQKHFSESIKFLRDGVGEHSSIDAFAKSLLQTNRSNELHNFKATLACFLTFEQGRNSINKRYDSFFACLTDAKKRVNHLPYNVKILSWNYDIQFEKGFSRYSSFGNDILATQTELNVFPPSTNYLDGKKLFSIFKLNGTAAIHEQQTGKIENIVPQSNAPIDIHFLHHVIRSYAGFLSFPFQWKPLINFAFEDNEVSKRIIFNAKKATEQSEILVVIGYSFPFFNREVDKEIIKNMKGLKKVYFQVPVSDIDNYSHDFRLNISDVEIVPYTNLTSFCLPPELSLVYH